MMVITSIFLTLKHLRYTIENKQIEDLSFNNWCLKGIVPLGSSERRVRIEYVTSESESEDEVQESNKKKRTRKNWIYERTFDDQEASKDWLDNEKIWSSLKGSETEERDTLRYLKWYVILYNFEMCDG
ncbi:hypothetical protein BpHYR1_047446 [Brachionus plicatilis]|uniref:Uncharacterized protein n=1 Tax=Brachionus plicatilis TaxID=10195 RepID=A0A3M7SF23_BRAPC|nr:hypothetical protein BpHYR1_047446 [Brachionus plicatilis]